MVSYHPAWYARSRVAQVFRSVDNVVLRHVIIARAAEWLDRCTLIEVKSARKGRKETTNVHACH
jgi:hypothetical protein